MQILRTVFNIFISWMWAPSVRYKRWSWPRVLYGRSIR